MPIVVKPYVKTFQEEYKFVTGKDLDDESLHYEAASIIASIERAGFDQTDRLELASFLAAKTLNWAVSHGYYYMRYKVNLSHLDHAAHLCAIEYARLKMLETTGYEPEFGMMTGLKKDYNTHFAADELQPWAKYLIAILIKKVMTIEAGRAAKALQH